MDEQGERLLSEHQTDFRDVTGKPFSYFFCPILFRDQDVELCKGHIVNRACPEIGRQQVIQRADVDNFWGTNFEADFVDLQHAGKVSADQCLIDATLASKFRPQLLRDGQPVGFYHRNTATHIVGQSNVDLETPRGTAELRLKVSPDKMVGPETPNWEISISKDMRLPALVSLLKAAHLTLFRMLGYRYVLSASGHFVGWDILGKFFEENAHSERSAIIQNALPHFQEFANLVRPVTSHKPILEGTAADNHLYICETSSKTPWAFMVFVKTTDAVHAVLVPIFEHPAGIERFLKFLHSDGGSVEGRFARFDNGEFKVWPRPTTFAWPVGYFTG